MIHQSSPRHHTCERSDDGVWALRARVVWRAFMIRESITTACLPAARRFVRGRDPSMRSASSASCSNRCPVPRRLCRHMKLISDGTSARSHRDERAEVGATEAARIARPGCRASLAHDRAGWSRSTVCFSTDVGRFGRFSAAPPGEFELTPSVRRASLAQFLGKSCPRDRDDSSLCSRQSLPGLLGHATGTVLRCSHLMSAAPSKSGGPTIR